MTPTLQARPTTYKGIKMRSRLEAGFAAWLDEVQFSWQYEPQCYASELGQYLPDFLLRDAVGPLDRRGALFVEIKPEINKDLIEELKRNTLIIRDSEPDALVVLAHPKRRNELWVSSGEHVYMAQWAFHNFRPCEGPLVSIVFPLIEDGQPWPAGYWE